VGEMSKVLQIFENKEFSKNLKSVLEKLDLEYLCVNSIDKASSVVKNEDVILSFFVVGDFDKELEIKIAEYKDKIPYIPTIVVLGEENELVTDYIFSKNILDYVEGKIKKESLEEYIKLMLSKERAIQEKKKVKIAVVDDNALELNIIRAIFEEINLKNVKYFQNPEELLQKDEKFDVYMIDLVMPRISGRSLMKKLKEINPKARIIAASALDNPKTISDVLVGFADDYIIKPFQKELLEARLHANIRSFWNVKKIEQQNVELEKLNAKLEKMVLTDGLTEIYNHKYIYDRLEKEIKGAKRYGRSLAVLMFDIDYFKKINDEYGHQTGDIVLKYVSKFLKKELRETDIVGRYGGEEFVAILPETELIPAYNTAERIRVGLQNSIIENGIQVTISGGVVELTNEANALELIGKVDMLLYMAKHKGRNRVEQALNDVSYYGSIGGEA
jgi:two-component system cell cycle response regulator